MRRTNNYQKSGIATLLILLTACQASMKGGSDSVLSQMCIESTGLTANFHPMAVSQGNIWYVKAGGTGNGTSWASPIGTIDSAMTQASVGDEIWVASRPKGANGIDFYYESSLSVNGGIGQILVKDGVSLYGGFKGTETSREQRNPKVNVTSILLQFRLPMLQDKPTVIDGFTFLGGSDIVIYIGDVGSNGTCQQLTISNNVFNNGGFSGGAIFTHQPPFTCDATIVGNLFGPDSSPIYIAKGAPKILNNILSGGGTTKRGGIMVGAIGVVGDSTGAVVANNSLWGMAITILNTGVLVANNTLVGGEQSPIQSNTFGIKANGGVTVVNNIIAFYGSGIYAFAPITAHHNLVYGNLDNYFSAAVAGNGDIQKDPLVLSRSSGNLYPRASSPAINAGDSSAVSVDWVDAAGFPRANGAVDIGAYEFTTSCRGL